MNSIKSDTKNMGNSRYYFIFRLLGIIGVLALLAEAVLSFSIKSSSLAATGDWSTYLADSGRSGFNAAETTLNSNTAPNLKPHWSFTAGAQVIAEPVAANGRI